MASKPCQRSLKYLRDAGWTVCIVEKYIAAIKQRKDAFGFGDLLACRPANPEGVIWTKDPTEDYHGPQIALVQTTGAPTSGGWFAQHKAKILASPEFQKWKDAGGLVFLHGWGKQGPRGKRKTWTLREEVL